LACPVWHHPECPLEPPGADPHAGWCGRGAAQRAAPYADPLLLLLTGDSPLAGNALGILAADELLKKMDVKTA